MVRSLRSCAVLAALGTASCSVNPATGERQFLLMSEAQEIAMGREYDRQVIATMGLVPDSGMQRYVQALGGRIAATSEKPDLPWTFRVVDDPVVNAFALPGGFVYVTRGILAHFANEAQLAAVLGHEIGHVTARHAAEQASERQLAQLGLAVGVLLEPELEPYAGIAQAGLALLFLSHSRDDEREADDLGLRYVRQARFDAREMPEVFTMLARVSAASGGGGPPEWLSTHPDPENRRERLLAALDTLPPEGTGIGVSAADEAEYLGRIDGLVVGPDPRQGYFRDTRFRHPELQFAMEFPGGWSTVNQPTVVAAVSPGRDAIVQLQLADAATPEQAARAFFSQQGVQADRVARRNVGGLSAVGARFVARTGEGALQGEAIFVEHRGTVYQVVGFATAGAWPGVAGPVHASLTSFEPLEDPRALAAEPRRLAIVTLPTSMRFGEFAERYGRRAGDADLLMLLNQTHQNARFARGARLKTVTEGVMP